MALNALLLFVLCLGGLVDTQVIEHRVVTYVNQTLTSASTITTSPASTSASHGHSNSTITTASQTANDTSCCYIVNNDVGINTWYTNTANVTVATAITYWLKYNNTVMSGNTSIVTDTSALAALGKYAQGAFSVPYTTWTTQTETLSYNRGGTSGWSTWLTETWTRVSYTVPTALSQIPITLLNQSGQYYQEQWIATETAMVFPSQSLTVYSPTPYFSYPFIGLLTSAPCGHWTTTSGCASYSEVSSGTSITYICGSSYTTAYSAGAPNLFNAFFTSTAIDLRVVQPFPAGDYSNFSYAAFIDEYGITIEGGGENVFQLPGDLPSFLAGIPAVKSAFPEIGSCRLGVGQGEPTVHVPVNALTAGSQVTVTMSGMLNPGGAGTPTSTDAGKTTAIGEQGGTQGQSPTNQQSTGAGSAGSLPTSNQQGGGEQSSNPEPLSTGSPSDTSQGGQPATATGQPGSDAQLTSVIGDTSNVTPSDGPSTGGQPRTTDAQPSNAVPLTHVNPASVDKHTTSTAARIGDIIASVIGQIAGTKSRVAANAENTAPTTAPAPDDEFTLSVGTEALAITRGGSSTYVFNGQTLSEGDAITAEGHVYSLATSGGAVVVDHTTVTTALLPLGGPTPIPSVPVGDITLPFATLAYSVVSGSYVIGSETLSIGEVATISGETLSLGSSGALVVDDNSTITLAAPTADAQGVITVDGSTVTFDEDGNKVIIGTQTLLPDSRITVDGETLSLLTGGSEVLAVSGAITSTIELQPTTTKALVATSNQSVYSAFANSAPPWQQPHCLWLAMVAGSVTSFMML